MSSYHHGNLRASLVETGVELARTHGPGGVVLREVARRAGVSHNAAYRHFADREALLAEIATFAMQQLGEAMQREIEPLTDSDARLRATGRAYVEYAVANPGLFEVAFSVMPPEAVTEWDELKVHPYGLLCQVLDEGTADGSFAAELRPGADVVCWAAVHGFSVLHVNGPLRTASPEERRAAMEAMLDLVSRGLAA